MYKLRTLTNDEIVSEGGCPFLALFNKNFYYKAIVFLPLTLLSLAVKRVLSFNIKRIIIIIDEFIEGFQWAIEVPRKDPEVLHDLIKNMSPPDRRRSERSLMSWFCFTILF